VDEYGTYRNTKEDFDELKMAIGTCAPEPYVFTYSYDGIGAMIIMLIENFKLPYKPLPFGGNPRGSTYVGILNRGFDHLPRNELHAGYIAEKLNLGEADSNGVAELWNNLYGNIKT
jgi:hypothetical protein